MTFPARAKGSGPERRYVNFLRSVDGAGDAGRRLKAWILEEYRRQRCDLAHAPSRIS